jgi:hypothetical protein
MAPLACRLPRLADPRRDGDWTEIVSLAFVLLVIPYLNLVKNVAHWVQLQAVPARICALSARAWFDLGYSGLAIAVSMALIRHRRSRLALVPENPLGQSQLFFLVFLWPVVIGNLMRAIPPFQEQRLITEGVIYLNAVLCSVFILLRPTPLPLPHRKEERVTTPALSTLLTACFLALLLTVGGATLGTRAIHGNSFVPHAGYRTRFGSDAVTGKPLKGRPHP